MSDGDRLGFHDLRWRRLQDARLNNSGLNYSGLRNDFRYRDWYDICRDWLFDDETGVRGSFRGGDTYGSDAGGLAPTNARYLGTAVDIGVHNGGMRAVGKRSSGIGVGQAKGDGRSGREYGCAVGDLHSKPIR